MICLALIVHGFALNPRSYRFCNGTRECTTDIYDPSIVFPRGLIGPATFIWDVPSTTEPNPLRRILIRLHPTINKQVFAVIRHVIAWLQSCIANSLERAGVFASVRALDKELITFEITGRRATEVVKAVLKPTLRTEEETKQVGRLHRWGETSLTRLFSL